MYWYEVYRYAAAAMLVCSVVPDQPTEVGIAGTAGRRAAGAAKGGFPGETAVKRRYSPPVSTQPQSDTASHSLTQPQSDTATV